MASFPPFKKKKRWYDQLGSPFPIPLAAFTGVPASAANWQSYEAYYSQGIVKVKNPEHAEALWNNGYYGKGKASAQNYGSNHKDNGNSPWQQRHKIWKLIEYDGLKFPNCKESEHQFDTDMENIENKGYEKSNDENINMESAFESQGGSCSLDEENIKDNDYQKNNDENINMESLYDSHGGSCVVNKENIDDNDHENIDDIGQSSMSDNICKNSDSFKDIGKVLLVLHSDRSGVMSNVEGEKQLENEYQQQMDDFSDYGDGESSRTASIIDSGTSTSLFLTPEEAMFLSYALGCLTLINEKKHGMSIDEMWREFIKEDIRFTARYAVYHHFRAKGWVVKPGLKFGSDWLLYPVGPPFYHAHFTVNVQCLWADTHAIDESLNWREMSWTALSATERLNTHVKKTPILAVVLRPRNITRNRLNHISCLKELKVKEVMLSRWDPDPNRKTEEEEEEVS